MFRRGKKKSEGSSSAATPERKKKGRMFRKANKNKQRYEEEPQEAANDYDYETGLPEFPPGSNDGSERNVDLDADIDHSSGMDDEFGYQRGTAEAEYESSPQVVSEDEFEAEEEPAPFVEPELDRKARARLAVEERKRKAREAVAARKARKPSGKKAPALPPVVVENEEAKIQKQQSEKRLASEQRARMLEAAEAEKRKAEEEELRREEAEMRALEEELKREEEEAKKIAAKLSPNGSAEQEAYVVQVETVGSEEDGDEAEIRAEKAREEISERLRAKAEKRFAKLEAEAEARFAKLEAERERKEQVEAEKRLAKAEAQRVRKEEMAKLEAELKEDAERLKNAEDDKAREEEEKRKAEEARFAKLEAERERKEQVEAEKRLAKAEAERVRKEEMAKLEAELKEDAERLKNAEDDKAREEEEKRKAEEALKALQQFVTVETTPDDDQVVEDLGDVIDDGNTPRSTRSSALLDELLDTPRSSVPNLDALLDDLDDDAFVDGSEHTSSNSPEKVESKSQNKKNADRKPKEPKADLAKSRYKELIKPSPPPKRKPLATTSAQRATKPKPRKVAPPKPKPRKVAPPKPKPRKVAPPKPKPRPRSRPKPEPRPTAPPKRTVKPKSTQRIVNTTPRSPDKAPSSRPKPDSSVFRQRVPGKQKTSAEKPSPSLPSIDSMGSQCTISSIPPSPFLPLRDPGCEVCENKYIPNLHPDVQGCQVCIFKLSDAEREQYEKAGRHLRVVPTSGGCRDCNIFPSEDEEAPVRLCKKCFFDTHLLAARQEEAFGGTGPLVGARDIHKEFRSIYTMKKRW